MSNPNKKRVRQEKARQRLVATMANDLACGRVITFSQRQQLDSLSKALGVNR